MTGTAATDGGRLRPLRRDAQANRERLLAAAVRAVLREGWQVPMTTIAAEAGVGIGTLYRRYPNRAALLDALTLRAFTILVRIAGAAEARDGNALERLDWWWDRVLDQRDQLVLPLGGGPATLSPEVLAERARLHDSLQRILESGQRAGVLRPDVTTEDLIVFGAMLVAPLPGVPDWDAVARRQKRVHLDGLAAPARRQLPYA